jgi:folate-binding Fe-S cluster repair protein YgfZ
MLAFVRPALTQRACQTGVIWEYHYHYQGFKVIFSYGQQGFIPKELSQLRQN